MRLYPAPYPYNLPGFWTAVPKADTIRPASGHFRPVSGHFCPVLSQAVPFRDTPGRSLPPILVWSIPRTGLSPCPELWVRLNGTPFFCSHQKSKGICSACGGFAQCCSMLEQDRCGRSRLRRRRNALRPVPKCCTFACRVRRPVIGSGRYGRSGTACGNGRGRGAKAPDARRNHGRAGPKAAFG